MILIKKIIRSISMKMLMINENHFQEDESFSYAPAQRWSCLS